MIASSLIEPDVSIIKIAHKAGSLQELLRSVDQKGVNIEYMYGLSIDGEDAYVVLKAGDMNKVDAILCVLPHHLHYECGMFFARHKKHILMEKPLCNTEEECLRLIEICEEEKVVLDKLNIDIEDESFVAVIGQNGSGKSTILNVISNSFMSL